MDRQKARLNEKKEDTIKIWHEMKEKTTFPLWTNIKFWYQWINNDMLMSVKYVKLVLTFLFQRIIIVNWFKKQTNNNKNTKQQTLFK